MIETVRERIHSDRRALVDPAIKQWCGQRWRDLFLREAENDERAVRTATGLLGADKRPIRQRLAERFLARDVEDWRLELPQPIDPTIDTALMFCPGFVHRAIPVVGLEDLESVAEGFGSTVVRADAHPARGCAANMTDLLAALDSADDADVVMFGYSKGSPDALTLLAHRPDVAGRVRAMVCWAGAVGGSPTAEDVYELIKDIEIGAVVGNELVLTALKAMLPIAQLEGMIERPDEWDLRGAIRDLSTTERGRFLAEHGALIDALNIPIFNVVGVARPLEVPYFQMQGSIDIGRRVGPNDMQVAVDHAQVTSPMGTTLAVCRAHHWDLALGPFPLTHRLGSPNLDNPFPRRAAITATVLLLAELGIVHES
ncbi:MAG: hypothetical protein ABFC96_13430 [Thermoguttaceae bacterium]